MSWKTEGAGVVVEQVVRGNSGADAGLLPGDELLAINGLRVRADNYAARIHRFHPDEKVVLTLSRHDRLVELPVRVQIEIPDSYLVYPADRISRREKSRMEAWLGRDLMFKR